MNNKEIKVQKHFVYTLNFFQHLLLLTKCPALRCPFIQRGKYELTIKLFFSGTSRDSRCYQMCHQVRTSLLKFRINPTVTKNKQNMI